MEGRERRLREVDGDLRRLIGEVEERDPRLTAADGDLRRLLLAVARRDERRAAVEGRLADAERDRDRLSGEVQERGQRLAVVENRLHEIETSRLWRILSPTRHAWARFRTTIRVWKMEGQIDRPVIRNAEPHVGGTIHRYGQLIFCPMVAA